MRPLRLMMQAFGPYVAAQTIDFTRLGERQFFLVHGPTGAGKTTIFDAICFALYGKTSSERDARNMRSAYAPASLPTRVELDFALGDTCYRVVREPAQRLTKQRGTGTTERPAKVEFIKIAVDGTELESMGDRNVQGKILDLIGFDVDQFRQVVLLPQGNFRQLLLASSAEREQILAKLFATEIAARVAALLKERAQMLASSFEEAKRDRERDLGAENVATEEELQSAIETTQAEWKEAKDAELVLAKARQEAQQSAQAAQTWQDLKSKETTALAVQKKLADESEMMQEKAAELERWQKATTMADSMQALTDEQTKGSRYRKQQSEWEPELTQLQEDALYWGKEEEFLNAERSAQSEYKLEQERLTRVIGWFDEVAQLTRQEEENKKKLAAAQARQKEAQAEAEQISKCITDLSEQGNALRELAEKSPIWEEKLASQRRQQKEYEAYRKRQQDHDAVSGDIETVKNTLALQQTALQNVVKKREHLADLREKNWAAWLGAELTTGTPCPVCGSLHHPQPAVADEEMPDEATWQEVQEEEKLAQEKLAATQQLLSQLTERESLLVQELNAADALLTSLTDTQLAEQEAELQSKHQEATAAQAEFERVKVQLTEQQKQEKKANETLQKINEELAEIESAGTVVATKREEAQRQIPPQFTNAESVKAQVVQLKEKIENYERREKAFSETAKEVQKKEQDLRQQYEEVTRRLEECRHNYKTKRDALLERAKASGFTDMTLLAAAIAQGSSIPERQQEIQKYQADCIANKTRLEEIKKELDGMAVPDLEKVMAAVSQAEKEHKAAVERKTMLGMKAKRLADVAQKMKEYAQIFAKLDQKHAVVGRLSELANGSSVIGEQGRLSFQRYVLQTLLDDVIMAANVRLEKMSHRRYQLVRAQAATDQRRAAGLDLEVNDFWTGDRRPANTLSGGETFQASLALALGLADTAQAYAGGLRLDTVFVDEGFGTLDADALNEAIRILTDLREGGRLVGIISHVEELRQRIDTRLEIEKTETGSRAHWVLG